MALAAQRAAAGMSSINMRLMRRDRRAAPSMIMTDRARSNPALPNAVDYVLREVVEDTRSLTIRLECC